jgi:WD40 repeat protein
MYRDSIIPGNHRGEVRSIVSEGDIIISAGEDGFFEIWDINKKEAVERFQVSSLPILSTALRPGKKQICFVENDGLGLYRVSAWDYQDKKKLFSLRFRDSINFINYSAGGNFIIVARSGRTGLVFIHPETGELLRSPGELTGAVGFAATGRSERTMAVYLSSGILSYWDLSSGTETSRFNVPSYLGSPLLFGNNRFLAGIDSRGIVVLDAVSGDEIAGNSAVSPGGKLCAAPESQELVFYSKGENPRWYRFRMENAAGLEISESGSLPLNTVVSAGAVLPRGLILLGTSEGKLILCEGKNSPVVLSAKNQERIVEAAASRSGISYITEEGRTGLIPLDFFRLENMETLNLEKNSGYTRVNSVEDKFLFWQNTNTRQRPLVRDFGKGNSTVPVEKLPFRHPVLSVSALNEKILFLDSAGNISLINSDAGNMVFSFSSIGSMDAAFINDENIIIGRSALSENTAFLKINTVTGETVPLAYPSSGEGVSAAGARLLRGSSGTIYAAAVSQNGNAARTIIVRFNTDNPSLSVPLMEYQGEDTTFSAAESGGNLALTLGGEGASIYTPSGLVSFERSPGLPMRLLDGGVCFIAIDADGNICWHDQKTGRLLALFRLYRNEWILQTGIGETIWGEISFR